VATVPDQAKPVGYRVIPADVNAADLVMSHTSTNFDRLGFQQDSNVVFPIDRLRELKSDGLIDSVADFHYSFMGAVDPRLMRPAATRLSTLLKDDRVNAVLLVPV
jgi:D-proline reductase (dithiol) PrdB